MSSGDTSSFGLWDYVIVASSFSVSIAIGLYSSGKGKNETKEDVFLGGRKMPLLPVAISIMVGLTLNSSSYLNT